MISLRGDPDSASLTGGKYFSRRSRPFQLGITTLAAPVSGAVFGGNFLRGVSVQNRSHRNRAAAASTSRIGEQRARGRPRSCLQAPARNRLIPSLPCQVLPRPAGQREDLGPTAVPASTNGTGGPVRAARPSPAIGCRGVE